jgi:hypothetical protein
MNTILLPTAASAAFLAAFVSVFSLWRNRMEGVFREDPLHMMQFLFYFGLLIFSIGEIAFVASILYSDDVLISYIPSITRMFGMLFWLLGVLNYVRATDKVLKWIDFKVWILQLVFCSVSVLFVIIGIYIEQPNTNVITTVNLSIFTLGTCIMTCFIFYLLWIFKKGKFRYFILAIFSCLFLMLIRNIVIAYSTNALLDLVALTLALESYVCIWISESLFFQLFRT